MATAKPIATPRRESITETIPIPSCLGLTIWERFENSPMKRKMLDGTENKANTKVAIQIFLFKASIPLTIGAIDKIMHKGTKKKPVNIHGLIFRYP